MLHTLQHSIDLWSHLRRLLLSEQFWWGFTRTCKTMVQWRCFGEDRGHASGLYVWYM